MDDDDGYLLIITLTLLDVMISLLASSVMPYLLVSAVSIIVTLVIY